jgi:hypothetical protein
MKKSLEQIKTSIEVNGYSPIQRSQSINNYVSTAIGVYRLRHSDSDILRMLVKKDSNRDYFKGRRFQDNSTLTIRIISAVYSAFQCGGYDLNNREDIKTIEDFIENLSGSEMDALILDAFADCASSDYYYSFEKEWQ